MQNISISSIEDGNFLRLASDDDIDDLKESLDSKGQLSPIRVRKHPAKSDTYQVIFGNRRLKAARLLGWTHIRCEVVEASDLEAALVALAENLDRKDLSDFEKALVLAKIHSKTGKSYGEIARMIGKSPAFVSLHVSMLQLFPPDLGITEQERDRALSKISERHARVLASVEDPAERWDIAKLAINANLGVRELERICKRKASRAPRTNQVEILKKIVYDMIEGTSQETSLPPKHMGGQGHRYDCFPSFPSVFRAGYEELGDHRWTRIRDLVGVIDSITGFEVRTIGDFACAKICLKRRILSPEIKRSFPMRVTMVFEKEKGEWKLMHDHWSTLDVDGLKILSLLTQRAEAKIMR